MTPILHLQVLCFKPFRADFLNTLKAQCFDTEGMELVEKAANCADETRDFSGFITHF